jgi:type IV pilus assembly protein PilZ
LVEQFRRTDPRYDRRLEVELVLEGKRYQAVSRNISLGGMYLETKDTFPLHATLQLRFRVPTQPEAIDVTGEVRWVEKPTESAPGGLGIRFHGLRARDVWALNRFFQT